MKRKREQELEWGSLSDKEKKKNWIQILFLVQNKWDRFNSLLYIIDIFPGDGFTNLLWRELKSTTIYPCKEQWNIKGGPANFGLVQICDDYTTSDQPFHL